MGETGAGRKRKKKKKILKQNRNDEKKSKGLNEQNTGMKSR